MAPATLHPDLEPLSFLLGTWLGEGEGTWPGSDDFRFGEEVVFEHVGEPYLVYRQRSWTLESEEAIHLERGFVRAIAPGRVDVVLAHPLGVAEVAEGIVAERTVEVASSAIALAPTGSPVTDLRRRLTVDGDVLTYELHMATTEVPLVSHIRSRLVRA
jgi:hypothetical protein